jgi:4-hydroxy-3-polyprenylbenzoate decarboxylase
MAWDDYREFLTALERAGELRRIEEPVSPYLEVTEIADRVMKAGGPALLFENVVGPPHRLGTPDPRSAVMGMPSILSGAGSEVRRSGSSEGIPPSPRASELPNVRYAHPISINAMGSRRRMSMALSCDDFEEHAARIAKLLPPPIPKSPKEALSIVIDAFKEVKDTIPKTVSSGPCQEIVMQGDEIDLRNLPILTCWPEDGGPFITLPLVFTYDPNTGKRNVGMYRMQLYDRNTLGMHWQMHKTGMRHMEQAQEKMERIQVAVALGGDPAYTFSAISPLPPGLDEMAFAGFLRRKNAELVQCKTIDMKVPADAEIILEGYVDPSERRLEGPFGDHTGYYSLAGMFPVFHCTCVTMRQNAIYPATIVGQPPMEDGWMGKAVERIFMPMIRLTVPEIVDIHLPVEACFHNVAFVSIKKKYPGHAYKVMNAIWGLGGLAFTKFVFIFDEDVDVQDTASVLFRLGANCDPGRDALHSRGPVDQLDHASLAEGFGGKIGFDCTHKWPGENGFSRDFPKLIEMSPDVKRRIDALWPKLGL